MENVATVSNGLIFIGLGLLIGLLPLIIANVRRHRNRMAIVVLNICAYVAPVIIWSGTSLLFSGLIPVIGGLLWLVAFIWSCTDYVEPLRYPKLIDPRWRELRA